LFVGARPQRAIENMAATANFNRLLGTLLLDGGEGDLYVQTSDALGNKKYVMLYFSAKYCPPCRSFTPLLAEAYNAHKRHLQSNVDGDEIEVVFVSFDSTSLEYNEYKSTMPWPAVPFDNLWRMGIKDSLSRAFGIRSIPTLIILDGQSGDIVTRNGRSEYSNFFQGEYEVPSGCLVS